MGKKEVEEKEAYSSMVNHNTMLLKFEGWIKYIEGFSRGLQTTKTVDAGSVFDCVGEIMEYMRELKNNLLDLLQTCESILEENEKLKEENNQLRQAMSKKLIELKEEDKEDGKM